MSAKMKKVVEDAEFFGWQKFTSESGTKMVVCTQENLDEILAQQKKKAVEDYVKAH